MEIFLIRHGKTAGNLERRYIGKTDEPLCPEGIDEIASASGLPESGRVYVSPMRRAVQTAGLMFPNAELIPVPEFCEMDFGVFEGRNHQEMRDDPVYRAWVDGGCAGDCPEGEGMDGLSRRVCTAFDRITAAEDGRVVIVAHGGTIMSIMSSRAEPRRSYYEWYCENAHGWRAIFKNGRLTDCHEI